jgi:hypothetical protein
MGQGRRYTVDTHPDRDKIIKAIIRGDQSLRNIGKQYGVSIACIAGYLKDKLAVQSAKVLAREGDKNGKSLLGRVETIMTRMQKLYDACDDYLQDPQNGEKYYLGPRAHELQVVYEEPAGKKTRRRKASLDYLLKTKIAKNKLPLEVSSKYADPRKLIIDTAAVLSKQLELIGKITQQLPQEGNTTVNVLVINPKSENFKE